MEIITACKQLVISKMDESQNSVCICDWVLFLVGTHHLHPNTMLFDISLKQTEDFRFWKHLDMEFTHGSNVCMYV